VSSETGILMIGRERTRNRHVGIPPARLQRERAILVRSRTAKRHECVINALDLATDVEVLNRTAISLVYESPSTSECHLPLTWPLAYSWYNPPVFS
jgi:hypothetical protein